VIAIMKSAAELGADALAIWQAGVDAVRSDRLVKENARVEGDWLVIGESAADEPVRLAVEGIGRIAVVGAGKAGAGMAAGLLEALGPRLVAEKRVSGWVNVPADCVRELGAIQLHAARPAGVNEPTADGVFGAEKILEIATSLGADDLCICLISGGGSALMPVPVEGVSLAEKQAVTRLLSAGGANIEELNTVRKQLSRIKGGGLARACRAGRLITLIVSDVLGDPLDVIASGPTVEDSRTAEEALAILRRYAGNDERVAPGAFAHLKKKAEAKKVECPLCCQVTNLVIGNNAVAVDAAGMEAERRGYSHAMHAASKLEGAAEDVGRDLARMSLKMMSEDGPDCLITGGEPTVRLATAEVRGKGGRNQQLVLAALIELLNAECGTQRVPGSAELWEGSARFCLLSAGTDGEDGPTDAAGAMIDGDLIARLRTSQLDPADYLRRNDAYSLFDQLGGLIKTGPTHTNVCDVRVVVVDRDG
jgi:hydroxypyruvate reductase